MSYFALYSHEQLDVNLQYRISKLTTILTREIVSKFFEDRRYIHLLTHLLQLLSTWMKTKSSQFTNSKAMVGEVIRLLLFIYKINKSPLNRDAFITVSFILSINSLASHWRELLPYQANTG